MHKLYHLSYVIIEGKERNYFWDSFLFTEEEQKPIVDYTYNSFDDFYNAVVSNSLPVFIDHGKTTLLHGYEFLKNKLSLDDFVIFMQEHYGAVMDDNTLKIMLGK